MSRTDRNRENKSGLFGGSPGVAYTIREQEGTVIELPQEDLAYLNSRWDEVTVVDSGTRQGVEVRVSDTVGVIGLPSGDMIYIEPKVRDCSLLYLLSHSGRLDRDLVLDSEHAGSETGESMELLEVLGRMFATELDYVSRRGWRQEYEQKEATEIYMRGRLQVESQLQKQGTLPKKFECKYDELDYDIKINRIVLAAVEKLSGLMSPSSTRNKLIRYREIIGDKVERSETPLEELSSVSLSHLSGYYERLLMLSEIILQEEFIQDVREPDTPFPSLTFDMPTVFEKSVVNAVRESVDTDIYRVRGDEEIGDMAETADGNDSRSLRPDVIIEDKRDNSVTAVGDAKWKKDDSRPSAKDFYQIAAYQEYEEVPGFLIYPHSALDGDDNRDGSTDETDIDMIYEYSDRGVRGCLFVTTMSIREKDEYREYSRQLSGSLSEVIRRVIGRDG